MSISRRDVLKASGLAPLLGVSVGRPNRFPPQTAPIGPSAVDVVPPAGWDYPAQVDLLPFGHGVASGDPLADRVIIWTRVSIPDDRGWEVTDPQGVTSTTVVWKVATDPDMVDVRASGAVTTDAGRDWTVKVDVDGLTPNAVYFYCFEALGYRSPVGRTRTAPGPDDDVTELHAAHVACTSWWQDHFSAYARIAERADLDLVIHVGDHVYEFCGGHPAVRAWEDRFDIDDVDARRWSTRNEARRRYALYYQDPHLMAAHMAAPWVIAVDNHDFADLRDESLSEEERRFGGAEVFWEWSPTRPVRPDHSGSFRPSPGPFANVETPRGAEAFFTHRAMSWGRLLSLIVIDWHYSRQLETEEQKAAANDGMVFGPAPAMLGPTQWRWLQDTFEAHAGATHRVLLNQKNMGQLGNFNLPTALRDGARQLGLTGVENAEDVVDIYPGWTSDRRQLFAFLRDRGIVDNIVLSGDSHGWWAYDLVEDSTAPDYNPVDPWAGDDAGVGLTPVGVELINGMGRPGLVDVVAETACEAGAGQGSAHSCFEAGSDPTFHAAYQAARTPAIAASLAAETAAMAANPNMRYMNWREYGHSMVHLFGDRSELELLASDKTVNTGPGETGPAGTPADTVLARYASQVGRPHLVPLSPLERTAGPAKPAVPAPATLPLRTAR